MGSITKMHTDREQAVAKDLYRNLKLLAFLTLLFLGLLAIAPAKAHFTEWRSIQEEYNRRARTQNQSAMAIGIQQIWRPEIDLTDRCSSCHVGMGAAPPLKDGGPLFGRHTNVHHEVASMGCTVCHAGQGRATKKASAHGHVRYWEEPMLARPYLQASCGRCHGDAARVPALATVQKGQYLFEFHGCQACHLVDGKGGTVGPDLSGVALKGYDRQWQIRHLRDPVDAVEGSRMMSFGHLSNQEVDAVVTYLETLVGAPKLMRGKSIAVELGCRGCHKIGGVGGDQGPDLSNVGAKTAVHLDFSHVDGPKTTENWHRAHLRNPQKVAPGSKMPAYRLSDEDEEALVTYVLSLTEGKTPLDQLPRLTILTRLQERRDFARDGQTLYQTFCSVCHGPDGKGMPFSSLGVTVPAVANPDLLSIASEDYLRNSIEHGRPGRDMPGWGQSGAGLLRSELEAIIAHLRSKQASPPPFDEVRGAQADFRLGQTVFGYDCAGCHGLDGQGTVIAPSLVNPEFLFVASDQFLYETITRGRANTAMPAFAEYDASTVAGLLKWIRRSQPSPSAHRINKMTQTVREVLHVDRLDAYRATGSPVYGRVLYESMCLGCHGPKGYGGLGSAIANRDFLRSASDGFIAGSILLGRGDRAMRPFGPGGLANIRAREVGDLIVYLRDVAQEPTETPRGRRVQGNQKQGQILFGQLCSACHGQEGQGQSAPALNNSGFLTAATDGFLQATIVRGRRGTAMRGFAYGGFGVAEIKPEEINDVVAYIRSWQPQL